LEITGGQCDRDIEKEVSLTKNVERKTQASDNKGFIPAIQDFGFYIQCEAS
jgi:hypothetical protein